MSKMDNLYDFFKHKSTKSGKNRGEILKSEQKRFQQELLESAPNSYEVVVRGKHIPAIIQDIYFNDQFTQGKHMIVPYGSDVNVGDYVYWDEVPYLALYKEDETVRSKQGVRIQKCDNVVRWDQDGKIIEVPALIEDKTSPFSDGLNKSGGKFVVASDQVSAMIQENEYTEKIKLNQRFIFDNSKIKIFRLTRIISLPSTGIIELVLKKDGYNPYLDNLELNIADYYKNDSGNILPTIVGGSKISSLDEFEVYTLDNYTPKNELKWEISGDNAVIKPVDNMNVEVYIVDKSKYLTYTLNVFDGTDLVASKEIHSTYI